MYPYIRAAYAAGQWLGYPSGKVTSTRGAEATITPRSIFHGAGDRRENALALRAIRDHPPVSRQVGDDAALQVERQFRVGRQVRDPAARAARMATDEDLPSTLWYTSSMRRGSPDLRPVVVMSITSPCLRTLATSRRQSDHSATVSCFSSAPRTSVISSGSVPPSASNRSSALVICAAVDRHDEVALGDPGLRGGGVVLHLADEEPIALRQSDGATQLARHVGRGQANAKASTGRRLAPAQGGDSVAQGRIGGDGQVEAVAEPVGVDAEQPAVEVDDRSAGRARHERRGVLDGSGNTAAARPTEGAAGARHESERDPRPVPVRVAEGHHGRADAGCIGAQLQRRGAFCRCLEDGEVAVGVDAECLCVGGSSIGEGDRHLVAVEVVRIRQDPVLADDHAGAATPSVADPDHRWSDSLRDSADFPSQLSQACHSHLRQ